jgi:MbtH protein
MDDDGRVYEVVRNIYGQYSVYPHGRPLPAGWDLVGKTALKDECLRYIEEVWTDMTPTYVRQGVADPDGGTA